MYREGAVRCSFIIIKLQTALPHAVWCGAVQCGAVQCGAVRLCHFMGGFGAIFTICAVYAVW